MKSTILGVVLLLLLGCASHSRQIPAPYKDNEGKSSGPILYFLETGHSIQPPFSSYYRQHKGLKRLGLPITEALEYEGWQAQYFQYGRLEAHPENQPDYFITLGWLGELSRRTQAPIHKSPIAEGHSRIFPASGHTLSGDFLTYFENNGDAVQFGRPISEAFLCEGAVCQDFQSARFIWRPQLPPSARVQLEALGENHFLSSNLPLALLAPLPSPPQAEIIRFPHTPLPQNVAATLRIEKTPRPELLRVVAALFQQNLPIEGYSPRLIWGNDSQLLPPTRSDGQTHALVDVTGLDEAAFTLYDQAGAKVLASANSR